jgi:hypothetical protein
MPCVQRCYLLLSVAWLQFSGYLLNSFFDDSVELLRWQLINGYAWVLLSAGMIFIARARLLRGLGIGARWRERSVDRERWRPLFKAKRAGRARMRSARFWTCCAVQREQAPSPQGLLHINSNKQ